MVNRKQHGSMSWSTCELLWQSCFFAQAPACIRWSLRRWGPYCAHLWTWDVPWLYQLPFAPHRGTSHSNLEHPRQWIPAPPPCSYSCLVMTWEPSWTWVPSCFFFQINAIRSWAEIAPVETHMKLSMTWHVCPFLHVNTWTCLGTAHAMYYKSKPNLATKHQWLHTCNLSNIKHADVRGQNAKIVSDWRWPPQLATLPAHWRTTNL